MDFLRHIEEDSLRFAQAVQLATPDAAVPSCPGWDRADLVWHLAEVQHFWAEVVEGRLADPDDVAELKRPGDFDALLALFDHARASLLGALGAAEPQTPVWTWSADKTVGFVRRRQAHEALIHRIDAELTAAVPSVVDAELARDGVDELVEFFVAGGLPEWATFTPDGTTVRLEQTDGPGSWGLQFGRFTGTSPASGKDYDLDATQEADVAADNVVSGSAADLDLWLWGRAEVERLTIAGDPDVPARLRAIASDSTQ
jgi:uncharacterized protein (TIGR03083 family)